MAAAKPFLCLPDCETTKAQASETWTGRKLLTVYVRPTVSPGKQGQWENPPIIEIPIWDASEQQLLLETLAPGTHVSVMGNPTWVRSRYGTTLRVNQARISLLPIPKPIPRQSESELNRLAAKRLEEFTAPSVTSSTGIDPWAMSLGISDEPDF